MLRLTQGAKCEDIEAYEELMDSVNKAENCEELGLLDDKIHKFEELMNQNEERIDNLEATLSSNKELKISPNQLKYLRRHVKPEENKAPSIKKDEDQALVHLSRQKETISELTKRLHLCDIGYSNELASRNMMIFNQCQKIASLEMQINKVTFVTESFKMDLNFVYSSYLKCKQEVEDLKTALNVVDQQISRLKLKVFLDRGVKITLPLLYVTEKVRNID